MECTQRTLARAFGPSTTHLITRVSTICQLKLTQSKALEQKRFDLRSLSPALRNLQLFLVLAEPGAVLVNISSAPPSLFTAPGAPRIVSHAGVLRGSPRVHASAWEATPRMGLSKVSFTDGLIFHFATQKCKPLK